GRRDGRLGAGGRSVRRRAIDRERDLHERGERAPERRVAAREVLPTEFGQRRRLAAPEATRLVLERDDEARARVDRTVGRLERPDEGKREGAQPRLHHPHAASPNAKSSEKKRQSWAVPASAALSGGPATSRAITRPSPIARGSVAHGSRT